MKAFPTLQGGIMVVAENESERTFLGCWMQVADSDGIKANGNISYSCDDPSSRFVAINLVKKGYE
jgi:hypothetical protein